MERNPPSTQIMGVHAANFRLVVIIWTMGTSDCSKKRLTRCASKPKHAQRSAWSSRSLLEKGTRAVRTAPVHERLTNLQRTTMSTNRHDAKWAEELTTVADATNPISFPTGGLIHRSTRNALPWKPGRGNQGVADPGRVEIPGIYIERLFKFAKVKDPKKLTAMPGKDSFLVKCLGIKEYMDAALTYLIDEQLFEEEDDDGNVEVYEYTDMDDLYQQADKMVKLNADSVDILVDENSFDWLQDFDDTPAEKPFEWLFNIKFEQLTAPTGTMELYIELSFLVGPRSTQAQRLKVDSIFHAMASVGGGGQLIDCVTKHFFGASAGGMEATFVGQQMPAFLMATQWPEHYAGEMPDLNDYARDLAKRASWKKASRQEYHASG